MPDKYAEQALTTTQTISHEQAEVYSGVHEFTFDQSTV